MTIFFYRHNYAIITLYILERGRLSAWSTSRIRPSWPQSRVRLNLLLALFHKYLPCLFWPTPYLAVCSNNSYFTLHPSLASRTANISVQVNNMATLHHIYTVTQTVSTSHLYYYPFLSSYFFHSFGQAGWPRPFLSITFSIFLNQT